MTLKAVLAATVLVAIFVVKGHAQSSNSHEIIDQASRMYELSETGDLSISVGLGETVLVLTVGGGGGGAFTTRYQEYIRMGGGGSTGQVSVDAIGFEDVSSSLESVDLIISAKIGDGGEGGGSAFCGVQPDLQTPEMGAGLAGEATVVSVHSAGDKTILAEFHALGGDGAETSQNSRICGGVCSAGQGFQLNFPPQGGTPRANGIGGDPGRANVQIVRGETVLQGSAGGAFDTLGFGQGGRGGGYDATVGTVSLVPGQGYNPFDSQREFCDSDQVLHGQSGGRGRVLIYIFDDAIGEPEDLVSRVLYDLFDRRGLDRDAAASFIAYPALFLDGGLDWNTDQKVAIEEARRHFNDGDSEAGWEVLSSKIALDVPGVGEPSMEQDMSASEAGLPVLLRMALKVLLWANAPGDQGIILDTDFDGISKGTLEADLKLYTQAYNAVLMAIQDLGGNNPYNHQVLRFYREKVDKISRELKKRNRLEAEALEAFRRSQNGGALLEDDVSPEEAMEAAREALRNETFNSLRSINRQSGGCINTYVTVSDQAGRLIDVHSQRVCF